MKLIWAFSGVPSLVQVHEFLLIDGLPITSLTSIPIDEYVTHLYYILIDLTSQIKLIT